MKPVAVAVIAFLLAMPSIVLAFEPPNLENPKTCKLSSGGGKCTFGFNEDGIVKLPDSIVTGQVTVEGGRTVHIIGGHIRLSGSSRTALAFNSPHNIYVEGLHVDSNGYCDVFAVRNHRGIQTNFTFQNIYAEGPKYNVVDGNCHGDLIQNQGTSSPSGGLTLRIENFVGVTGAQGFFIPFYADGFMTAELRNVYIRPTSGNWKPLLWFSSPKYGHPVYPVTLDNVWVDYLHTNGTGGVFPETGTEANGQISWPSAAKITGVVQKGFDVNEAEFKAHVGLNYDRSYFFPAEPDQFPDPEPEPETEPEPDHNEEPITKGKFKAWCRENHPRYTAEFCNI